VWTCFFVFEFTFKLKIQKFNFKRFFVNVNFVSSSSFCFQATCLLFLNYIFIFKAILLCSLYVIVWHIKDLPMSIFYKKTNVFSLILKMIWTSNVSPETFQLNVLLLQTSSFLRLETQKSEIRFGHSKWACNITNE